MFRTLILARDSDTALRLCVYLPLLWGPSGTEPGALASVEGPGPGGSKVRVQVGLFGQVRRAFSGCHLTPGLSQCPTHQEERALGGPVSGAARAVLFAGQDDEGEARLLVPLSGVEHIKLRRRGGRFY